MCTLFLCFLQLCEGRRGVREDFYPDCSISRRRTSPYPTRNGSSVCESRNPRSSGPLPGTVVVPKRTVTFLPVVTWVRRRKDQINRVSSGHVGGWYVVFSLSLMNNLRCTYAYLRDLVMSLTIMRIKGILLWLRVFLSHWTDQVERSPYLFSLFTQEVDNQTPWCRT